MSNLYHALHNDVTVSYYPTFRKVDIRKRSTGELVLSMPEDESILDAHEEDKLDEFIFEHYGHEILAKLLENGNSTEYRDETVYRITEDDVRHAIEDNYPELTEKQVDHFVDRAKHKLELDWVDSVIAFVEVRKDEIENV